MHSRPAWSQNLPRALKPSLFHTKQLSVAFVTMTGGCFWGVPSSTRKLQNRRHHNKTKSCSSKAMLAMSYLILTTCGKDPILLSDIGNKVASMKGSSIFQAPVDALKELQGLGLGQVKEMRRRPGDSERDVVFLPFPIDGAREKGFTGHGSVKSLLASLWALLTAHAAGGSSYFRHYWPVAGPELTSYERWWQARLHTSRSK